MRATKPAEKMSVEEYVRSEWTAACRHEYVDGRLFEMPGEQDVNNRLAGRFYLLFMQLLEAAGYAIYINDVKVAIPGAERVRYPDVFATAEPRTSDNKFIKHEPAIIVEVVSDGSHRADYVDNFIEYMQISSLHYYLIAEPETVLVTVCYREGAEWVTQKYTRLDETISLPLFGISLPMAEVYAGIL